MDEIQNEIFVKLVSDLSDQNQKQNSAIAELSNAIYAFNDVLKAFANRLNNLEKIPAEVRIRQTYSIPLFGKKLTTFFVTVLLFLSMAQFGVIWYYYDDFKVLEYTKDAHYYKGDNETVFEILRENALRDEYESLINGNSEKR